MISLTNIGILTIQGILAIGVWELTKFWFWRKEGIEATNIKTSYGEFPTMIHYENYWKKKVEEAKFTSNTIPVTEGQDG